MERDRDYLYHCSGCEKADKNYPDKEVECKECEGSGAEVIDDIVREESCWYCGGYGQYLPKVDNIEYHEWARVDAYGIYTGLYCEECYNNIFIYTYKKERYYDKSYCGENLEPEE